MMGIHSSLPLFAANAKGSTVSPMTSSLTAPALRHGPRNNHDVRRSSIILPSSSPSSNDEGEVPILRGLYDAPPRDDSNDGSKDTSSTSNADERWATQVTPGTLPTEEGSPHVLYYEVHRRYQLRHASSSEGTENKKGLTALFLHGGPGAACFPNHVRFFSPELYETVVLLDQRGCGKSTPLGETKDNTLELLVGDVERLRLHLLQHRGVAIGGDDDAEEEADAAVESGVETAKVRPWDVILGGSWGCTLALAYAHTYSQHVRAMVLRGVCLFRPQEIDWLFGDPSLLNESNESGLRTSNLRSLLSSQPKQGLDVSSSSVEGSTSMAENTASKIFPKGWKEFVKGIDNISVQTASTTSEPQQITDNNNQGRSMLNKYYHLLLGSDPLLRLSAVKSWMRWEMGVYSAGFRDVDEGKARKGQNGSKSKDDKHSLLIWDPAMKSWACEDARVRNNESFVSVDGVNACAVDEDMAQSLRRYSTSLQSSKREEFPLATGTQPIPVQPAIVTSEKAIPTPKATNNGNNNSTFDPTTYIPAQSMLTCYYSTNDDYCIGAYKSFLGLVPTPPFLPLSSRYSSILPPQIIPRLSATVESLTPATSTTTSISFPLPPTIAIQGGNDAICPPDTALDLHHVWKEMELRICMESGHSMYDGVIAGEIVKALDRFGQDLSAVE